MHHALIKFHSLISQEELKLQIFQNNLNTYLQDPPNINDFLVILKNLLNNIILICKIKNWKSEEIELCLNKLKIEEILNNHPIVKDIYNKIGLFHSCKFQINIYISLSHSQSL